MERIDRCDAPSTETVGCDEGHGAMEGAPLEELWVGVQISSSSTSPRLSTNF